MPDIESNDNELKSNVEETFSTTADSNTEDIETSKSDDSSEKCRANETARSKSSKSRVCFVKKASKPSACSFSSNAAATSLCRRFMASNTSR